MSPQFNMYLTDQPNDTLYFQSNCLYHRVPHHISLYSEDTSGKHLEQEPMLLNNQFIAYCMHASTTINDLIFINNTDDPKISFFQLSEKNITSEQLYKWSAPIDIIEHYQLYLMSNKSTNDSDMFFYNCTPPYFGSICQYSFLVDSTMTFSEIVHRTIQSKNNFNEFSELTCYIHLNCTRAPAPICLDWREICDGRLDCLDGEDENNCFDLEINECEEHEYRCQNGQCIPKTFFHDNPYNPDCLDRTDEPYITEYYPSLCSLDPSFRCADLQCRPTEGSSFVCGNGQCEGIFFDCLNFRNLLYLDVLFKTTNVSKLCQKAMQCIMGLIMKIDDLNECAKFCLGQTCVKLIDSYCPDEFFFPSYPIFFGHIRLLYIKNQLNYFSGIFVPNYVCYNETLCGSLFSKSIFNIGQLTCIAFLDIIDHNNIDESNTGYQEVFRFFSSCSSSRNFSLGNQTHCHDSSLYHCANTSKCISKHRLIDGIQDCKEGDDESYSLSCSLPDNNQRFTCSDDVTKCFNIHQLYNYIGDCRNGEDEINSLFIDIQRHIFFQTICDGFTELTPVLIDDHNITDETECENWVCDNIYTRCDGIWNCQNGSDEIDCACKGQMCVSLTTEKLTCLPATKVNDGKVDCIGGSDERQYCRIAEKNDLAARFLCRNGINECISVENLCDTQEDCLYGDDEEYCEHYILPAITNGVMCTTRLFLYNLTAIESFLCQIVDQSKRNMVYFTLDSNTLSIPSVSIQTQKTKRNIIIDANQLDKWLQQCHQGIPIYVRYIEGKTRRKCLCPPAYYGEICQYQNERISLTLKLQTSPADWRLLFAIVVMLIDNQEGFIEFADQLIYNHFENCQMKFDVNLLYSTRPKNTSKTYSIRIDAFDKQTLVHRSSWIYPVQFPYLPVYRLSVELNISLSDTKHFCSFNCSNHGQCINYENDKERHFCLCDDGWTGLQCSEKVQCNCAPDAKCISTSLCICKIDIFGTRCFLTDARCQSNSCRNGGTCYSPFTYDPTSASTCICSQGYSGRFCEKTDTKIIVGFDDIEIPFNILIHFIETFKDAPHLRTTTFKKITIGQNNIILFTSIYFHLIFVEFESNYYLLFTNSNQNQTSFTIETKVTASKKCASISDLFNNTFTKKHLLIRIKSYHLICQRYRSLSCFYDDVHLCLCSDNRHANCFEFNHSMTYNCRGFRYCENNAKCFQNNPYCPTSSMCVCEECYYGSRCQLSTIGIALALDAILGYQILQQISFTQQTVAVKISTVISTILFICGYLSGILSMITFQRKKSREVGCGYYLFSSSICLIITVTLLEYKFWFLVLSQMLMVTNHSILLINCITIDYLLRSFLSFGDWLNACVAIERAISIIRGVKFNKYKSIRIAKIMILSFIILIFVSHLQDPFHRHLIDDKEDNRIWCTTEYSSTFHTLNSAITIIHFFIPFTINFLSAVFIIIKLAQRRLLVQKQHSYIQHIYRQIQKHKHILISPFILIILALPRLLISLLSTCMKTQRDPWLFLCSYFVSFVPPIAHFLVFVTPSKAYREQFSKAILRIRQ